MSTLTELDSLATALEQTNAVLEQKGVTVPTGSGFAAIAEEVADIPEPTPPLTDYGLIKYIDDFVWTFKWSDLTYTTADWDKFISYCDSISLNIGSQGMGSGGRISLWLNGSSVNISSDNSKTVTKADFDANSGIVGWTGIGSNIEFVKGINPSAPVKTVELASLNEMNNLCSVWGSSITINNTTIPVAGVVGFEFGKTCTSVPNSFLYGEGFTNVNEITFGDAPITTIGNQFGGYGLAQKINSPIILPKTLVSIGNSFLATGGSSGVFNSTISFPETLETIGDDFLAYQTSFNQPIVLPNSLRTIGNGFLGRCSSFNQSLRLPDSLQSLGYNLLIVAQNMVSPVDFGQLRPTIVTEYAYDYAFAGYSQSPIYTTGCPIKGAYRTEWLTKYPDLENPSYSSMYRHLLDGGE